MKSERGGLRKFGGWLSEGGKSSPVRVGGPLYLTEVVGADILVEN